MGMKTHLGEGKRVKLSFSFMSTGSAEGQSWCRGSMGWVPWASCSRTIGSVNHRLNHGLVLTAAKWFLPLFFTTYGVFVWNAGSHARINGSVPVTSQHITEQLLPLSTNAFENGVNALQRAHMAPRNGGFPLPWLLSFRQQFLALLCKTLPFLVLFFLLFSVYLPPCFLTKSVSCLLLLQLSTLLKFQLCVLQHVCTGFIICSAASI